MIIIKTENNLLLSFMVEEYPNNNLYFQVLDNDLNLIGNSHGTSFTTSETNNGGFDMVLGDDGYVYYTYTSDSDLYLQKLDGLGNPIWNAPI